MHNKCFWWSILLFQDPYWHEEVVRRNVSEGVLLPGGYDLQWPAPAQRPCQKAAHSLPKTKGNSSVGIDASSGSERCIT